MRMFACSLRPHESTPIASYVQQIIHIIFVQQQIMVHSNKMYNFKCWFIYVFSS